MKKFLVLAVMLLASCAHQLKTPSDLQIDKSYPLLGAEKAEYRVCTMQARNVMTMMPSPVGVLPIAALGQTSAYVCGEIDCSAAEDKNVKGSKWYCAPFELLTEPLPQPEK